MTLEATNTSGPTLELHFETEGWYPFQDQAWRDVKVSFPTSDLVAYRHMFVQTNSGGGSDSAGGSQSPYVMMTISKFLLENVSTLSQQVWMMNGVERA